MNDKSYASDNLLVAEMVRKMIISDQVLLARLNIKHVDFVTAQVKQRASVHVIRYFRDYLAITVGAQNMPERLGKVYDTFFQGGRHAICIIPRERQYILAHGTAH